MRVIVHHRCRDFQGKISLSVSLKERLLSENSVVKARHILSVKVIRCIGLSAWGTSGLSDPYCQVMLLGNGPGVRSEVRRGTVRRRTVDPVFDENFDFIVSTSSLHYLPTLVSSTCFIFR